MFFAESRHSDPTADGAASAVPRRPNLPAGSTNRPCAIAIAPAALAESSAGEAQGIAARLLSSGAKIILTTPMGIPVTHTSYLHASSLQRYNVAHTWTIDTNYLQ